MEIAKQANALIKKAAEILSEAGDAEGAKRFENINNIFNNASGMVNGNEYCEAMLKGWMVSQANNAVFNLWRKQAMTPEIEEEFFKLPSTEEAVKEYDEFENASKEAAEKIEEERRVFMNAQHDIDIFKAVLNGLPKEKAEEQYAEYAKQISQAVRG